MSGHKGGYHMVIEIDFSSDEAIYMQLTNQDHHGDCHIQASEGDSSHLSGSLRIRSGSTCTR